LKVNRLKINIPSFVESGTQTYSKNEIGPFAGIAHRQLSVGSISNFDLQVHGRSWMLDKCTNQLPSFREYSPRRGQILVRYQQPFTHKNHTHANLVKLCVNSYRVKLAVLTHIDGNCLVTRSQVMRDPRKSRSNPP
jgi:hypothetical protein